ncbi:MAG: cytochrome-c peroxidase [Bdellovibrionales bacterium]
MTLQLTLMILPAFGASVQMAEIGKRLFFDPRLSADQKISCASCHRPELAFTNGERIGTGVFQRKGDRNVPTLLNREQDQLQFWDGRAKNLSVQALAVLSHPSEMGGDLNGLQKRISSDHFYQQDFAQVQKPKIEIPEIVEALVAYMQTLKAPEAPWDRFKKGESKAITLAAQRGSDLFFKKFKCVSCHSGQNFTDNQLRVRCYPHVGNLNVPTGPRFKTPTLRNLKYTAPYMHNGSLKTLRETVQFYTPSQALMANGQPLPNAAPMTISPTERDDLVAFLLSLSADRPFVESKQ